MSKIRTTVLAAAMFLLTSVGSAFATPVQIFSDWARGDMGTAHNSTDGQYIYCWVSSDLAGPPLLYCEAYSGQGQFSFCFSINNNLLSVLPTMTSESQIEFGWDDGHSCSFLMINNFSQPPGRKFP